MPKNAQVEQQRFSVRGSLKRARPEGHPVIRHQWRGVLTNNSSFSVCRLLMRARSQGHPIGLLTRACPDEHLTGTRAFPMLRSLLRSLFLYCNRRCQSDPAVFSHTAAVFSHTAIVDAKVILHFCVECPSETAAVDCCVSCMPSLLQQELVTLVML